MFRKFNDEDSEEVSESDADLLRYHPDIDVARTSALQRNSIKPRLLFPSQEQLRAKEARATKVEEEAATDVEECANASKKSPEEPTTPKKSTLASNPDTPSTPGRSLRPRAPKDLVVAPAATPSGQGTAGAKKISPFDSWQRVKAGRGIARSVNSKKRAGEHLERADGPTPKRPRVD